MMGILNEQPLGPRAVEHMDVGSGLRLVRCLFDVVAHPGLGHWLVEFTSRL